MITTKSCPGLSLRPCPNRRWIPRTSKRCEDCALVHARFDPHKWDAVSTTEFFIELPPPKIAPSLKQLAVEAGLVAALEGVKIAPGSRFKPSKGTKRVRVAKRGEMK